MKAVDGHWGPVETTCPVRDMRCGDRLGSSARKDRPRYLHLGMELYICIRWVQHGSVLSAQSHADALCCT